MNFLIRAKTIRQDFTQETESLKKIDGVWYAIGFYSPIFFMCTGNDNGHYIHGVDSNQHEIHYNTRAIHFDDMIDSDKKPFFASIRKGGKGGDVMSAYSKHYDSTVEGVLVYSGMEFLIKGKWEGTDVEVYIKLPYRQREILGIQE